MTRGPTETNTARALSTDELTSFLNVFFDRYMAGGKPVSPEVHPLNVLREVGKKSPRKAEIGLRMAIADCIEMSVPWTSTQVAEADRVLSSNGVITLSELKRKFQR
jgi:hypothetical protein